MQCTDYSQTKIITFRYLRKEHNFFEKVIVSWLQFYRITFSKCEIIMRLLDGVVLVKCIVVLMRGEKRTNCIYYNILNIWWGFTYTIYIINFMMTMITRHNVILNYILLPLVPQYIRDGSQPHFKNYI